MTPQMALLHFVLITMSPIMGILTEFFKLRIPTPTSMKFLLIAAHARLEHETLPRPSKC